MTDSGFVITWHSAQDSSGLGVYAKHYDAMGVAQGPEFQVNTFTTNDQSFPAIASFGSNGGGIMITWQSSGQDGSGNGVYAKRFLMTNTQPQLMTSITDQFVERQVPFSLTIPANTFIDNEVMQGCQSLSYSTSGLPSWLSFNPSTLAFSGVPSESDPRSSTIVVIANDGLITAQDDFRITISKEGGDPPKKLSQAELIGIIGTLGGLFLTVIAIFCGVGACYKDEINAQLSKLFKNGQNSTGTTQLQLANSPHGIFSGNNLSSSSEQESPSSSSSDSVAVVPSAPQASGAMNV